MENENNSAGSLDDIAEAALNEVEGEESEAVGEITEDTDTSADDEPGESSQAQGNPEASEEDDDEAYLKANAGKAIPYPAFQKKYQKWKKRHAEAIAKAQELERRYAEASQRPALDPKLEAKYKRYEEVFGNYIEGAKRMPWIEDVLLKLGQGQDPDLKMLHDALGKHLQSAQPTTDPRIFKQIEELQSFRQKQEEEAKVTQYQRHLDQEDVKIRATYGDAADEQFLNLVNQIAAGQASLLPDDAPASAYPNRLEIAKQVDAFLKTRVNGVLKKQIPPQQKRSGVALNNGRGPAAGVKNKLPVPGSQEWMDAIQDDAFLADLTGEK